MKRLVPIVIILSLILVGCSSGVAPKTNEKLTVYTSFYVMYDFARKIAGDKADVINMMPPGAESHDWEPTPREIAGLESANVFVYNGLALEGWVEKVIPNLSSETLLSVNTSEGVTLLAGENHQHEDEEKHEDKEEHSHGEYDPHIWLDPLNAKIQMEHIKDALVTTDPKNTATYEANYHQYAEECDVLYGEFSKGLEARTHSEIVVSHEAYGYLCDAFGLRQHGVRGFSPEGEPSPMKMAEIIDFIREQDIKIILFEESGSKAVAEAIAKETGIEIALLSPVESLSHKRQEAGEDYFSVMRENLQSLEKAVG